MACPSSSIASPRSPSCVWIAASTRFEDGHGALELVAFVAGEPHGASPACVCPTIARLVRHWDASLGDAARQRLLKPLVPALVDSRATPAIEQRRAGLAADWYLRRCVTRWLAAAGLDVLAEPLRTLPPLASGAIVSEALADLAGAVEELWRAARAAARAAAFHAVHGPAWDAAWPIGWDKRSDAPLIAAWLIAWRAIESVRGDRDDGHDRDHLAMVAAQALAPHVAQSDREVSRLVHALVAVRDPSVEALDLDDAEVQLR